MIITRPGFAADTLRGLSAGRKFLLPKYFYDEQGSIIFQEIMQMPEYYLTAAESEIFTTYSKNLIKIFREGSYGFDLVELGSGDGVKTRILLNSLLDDGADFRFVPVDISKKSTDDLTGILKQDMPDLEVKAFTGDYFELIKSNDSNGNIHKVILFLGSNIGNFPDDELDLFLTGLSGFTRSGDKVVIGFDLKKSPAIIMNAYDDPYGLTRKFNLNHLARINRELHADFDLSRFEHFTEYNPYSGELKSYLISLANQSVLAGKPGQTFMFERWEPIFMELSRKFELDEIEELAARYGFKTEEHFTDHNNYFADSVWVKV